jgi:two-component system, OmpR family, alkaline phosphatase synthesis response regulator PhoP
MSKKRIIIIEDEPDMAELVALRLKREGYLVEICHNGAEGWKTIQADPPDFVLLDIMLPGLTGLEILQYMRKDPRTVNVPVILLTAKGEESDVVVGLQFGADDYISKPFSMSVLTARVTTVLRRSRIPSPSGKTPLMAGPITIDLQRHRVEVNGKEICLTLTEFKLLSALASAHGRVLTRNQLIDQAVGVDAVITDRTIDVHLTSLRRKLGSTRRLIETVRGVGYRFSLDDHEKA